MAMTDEEMKTFDWEDEIEDDGEERSFVTLEEGDYEFEITKFERSNYTPSSTSSLPACNMAVITLKVSTENGDAYITDKFQLCSKMEWKLSAFFRSIGLKKHGEKLKMKWGESIGCKGNAHVTKDAGKKENTFFNNVKYYIDPVAKAKGDDDTWS